MFWKKAKKKILVVDDEPDVLNLVQSRLEINNYDVVTASNGDEGVAKALIEHPDLILLDIIMPGKDGLKVCRELKDNPQTKQIPVIFLTAKGRGDDILEGTRLGAVNYVVKPYNPQEFLEKIERALREKR